MQNIKKGDILSEQSHYVVEEVGLRNVKVRHVASGQLATLSRGYIDKFVDHASNHSYTIKVGKEDKYWTAKQIADDPDTSLRVGDLRQKGIRTIWENIYSKQVFTVCYDKAPKKKTKKQLAKELDEQVAVFLDVIAKAAKQKKGVLEAATRELHVLQASPISNVIVEERILRGYKLDFSSRNGLYKVFDIENDGERQVNINTIKWIIIDDIKYIVD